MIRRWQRYTGDRGLRLLRKQNRILALMDEAGFTERKKMGARPVLFGLARAAYFRAVAPAVGRGQV